MRRQATLATAESCTGGRIASAITSVPGCSAYFKGSIVAYSNEVKTSLLHVREQTLETTGAVSRQTVCEMVKGAMESLHADYAVAVSGIAGPGGGTPDKPVGTIWIAAGCKDKTITLKQETDNGREQNVIRTSKNALSLLIKLLMTD